MDCEISWQSSSDGVGPGVWGVGVLDGRKNRKVGVGESVGSGVLEGAGVNDGVGCGVSVGAVVGTGGAR